MNIYYRKNQKWDSIEFKRRKESNVPLRTELEEQIKHKFSEVKGVIDIVDINITHFNESFDTYVVMLAII